MPERALIPPRLGLPPGNLAVRAIQLEAWGSQIVVDCIYRFPPEEKLFRLIFHDCRSIEWIVQKTTVNMTGLEEAQLIAHDLGKENYERTARLATTLAEVLIAYDKLKIERQW